MIDSSIAENIEKMTYPDFVAFLGQKNTPPGGLHSLKRWVDLAEICSQSMVLDLACSNGFSSREVAKITNCSGKGVDLSVPAIAVANEEAVRAGMEHLLHYQIGDASYLPFDDQLFSHILGGCNFSFISSRDKALSECRRTLRKNGKLCISNFFYVKKPPESLLDLVEQAIGFRPHGDWDYEWWDNFFKNKFSLLKEEIQLLPISLEEQLEKEIHNFIYEKSTYTFNLSKDIKDACFKKLLSIRKILNEHRKYQKFSISIWN